MVLQLAYSFVYCTLLLSVRTSAKQRNVEGEAFRIYGGDDISIEAAPYMAALYRSYDNITHKAHCGGSIVHRRFVLTAAHCIIRNNSNLVTSRSIRIGSHRLGSGILIGVEKAICHENFKFRTNDICLLKLLSPIDFVEHKVSQVQLPDDKDFELEEGTLVKVTGWGYTEDEAHMVINLRQVTIPIVSWERCRKFYTILRVTAICAGSNGLGSFRGDSGGPLMYNNVQIGVVSYGKTRTNAKGPGVFTNVAKYLDWIDTTITNNL